jgi:hypothetical protein
VRGSGGRRALALRSGANSASLRLSPSPGSGRAPTERRPQRERRAGRPRWTWRRRPHQAARALESSMGAADGGRTQPSRSAAHLGSSSSSQSLLSSAARPSLRVPAGSLPRSPGSHRVRATRRKKGGPAEEGTRWRFRSDPRGTISDLPFARITGNPPEDIGRAPSRLSRERGGHFPECGWTKRGPTISGCGPSFESFSGRRRVEPVRCASRRQNNPTTSLPVQLQNASWPRGFTQADGTMSAFRTPCSVLSMSRSRATSHDPGRHREKRTRRTVRPRRCSDEACSAREGNACRVFSLTSGVAAAD